MHDFQMLHTHAHMHSALSVVDQSQLQDINVYIYTYTDHFQTCSTTVTIDLLTKVLYQLRDIILYKRVYIHVHALITFKTRSTTVVITACTINSYK